MSLDWSVGLFEMTLSRRSDPSHLWGPRINQNSSHQKWYFFSVCPFTPPATGVCFASLCWTLLQSAPVITHHSGHEMHREWLCTHECVCVCMCVAADYMYVPSVENYRQVIYQRVIFHLGTTGHSSSLQPTETDWDTRDNTPMLCESISGVSAKRHQQAVCLFQSSSDVADNQPDICRLHLLDHWRLTESRRRRNKTKHRKRHKNTERNQPQLWGIRQDMMVQTTGMCLDERNSHFWFS